MHAMLASGWPTRLLLIAILACLTISAQDSRQRDRRTFESLLKQFDYDASAPLAVEVSSQSIRNGVRIEAFSYAGQKGDRVPAYLVTAVTGGRHPVILYGHWMMAGSPLRGKDEFLDEAVAMARAGAFCLLIDAPGVRKGYVEEADPLASARQSSQAAKRELIDLRRGLDYLLSRSDTDPQRVAYVGHSFGAHVGAILAAVDKRFHFFVLMAGNYADEEATFEATAPEVVAIRRNVGEPALRQYFRDTAWDDPVNFIGHSAPSEVFLQFASQDDSAKKAGAYAERFGRPHSVQVYASGHALNTLARLDRVRWLATKLKLRNVDLNEVKRIPQLR